MAPKTSIFFAVAAILALTACGNGGTNAEYTRERAINTDIDASRDHGPTASAPDIGGSEEPAGPLPWQPTGP